MSQRASRWTLLPILAVALATTLAPTLARGKTRAPTAPGKYSDWNGEIDELEIVAPWRLADYGRLSVVSFDTSDVALPEATDNTYEPVKKVLADPATAFVEGLRQNLKARIEFTAAGAAEAAADGGPKTLLIHGKVLTMDPGSKAARYWGGFGAGAARTKLSGELVDATSGTVLARFTQERRSGFGALGGDYVKLMNKNLRTIGSDVAGLLNAF